METNCKLLDIFHTSIGDIAVIRVSDDFIPQKGNFFTTQHNSRWKITGIGSNKIYELAGSLYDLSNLKSAWDCQVTSIGHNEALTAGMAIIFDR